MKIKNFLSVKCFEQMKRQAIEWEKILANHRLNKGILCRLYKEFQNSREKFQKGKKKNFKIGKRFIHLIRTDSNVFFLMAE